MPMVKAQILEEVQRLPQQEQIDVLWGIVQMVAPTLSAEEDAGLGTAIDEAHAGDFVGGPMAMARLRSQVCGPR